MKYFADGAKAIRSQIEADILAAWPDVTEIVRNKPRIPATPPYAGVSLTSVPMELRGVSKLGTLSFDIAGRFPIDPEEDIEDIKLARAQALIDRLEATADYADGVGLIPVVSSVDFVEHAGDEEYVLDVVLTFDVKMDRPHGSAA